MILASAQARSRGTNSGGAQHFFTTGPNASLLDGQGIYVVSIEVS